MYQTFFKRLFDILLSLFCLCLLWPVLLVLTVTGAIFLRGNPFFCQIRPGKAEKPFPLVKFRTMSNRKDDRGNLLPDALRLTPYGKILRATSLDELPELLNILLGHMSFVGPRPLLMQYLPLYNAHQRKRHTVLPGLTGLAQVKGRNALSWEERFDLDVWYVEHISFQTDLRILWDTVGAVFARRGIHSTTSATMEPFTGSEENEVSQ